MNIAFSLFTPVHALKYILMAAQEIWFLNLNVNFQYYFFN